MAQFLIESPHSPHECLMALQQTLALGYLTHFGWGCKSGQHCGWVILEAESESEALMVVPSLVRGKARAIRMTMFNPDEVKSMHEKK